jgi:hypothetical protein
MIYKNTYYLLLTIYFESSFNKPKSLVKYC